PENRREAFDPRPMLEVILDRASLFEVGQFWGRSVVTSYARIGGIPVGVIANDSRFLGGAIDAAAAQKQVRFVRTCDRFHLPLIFFVDVPGFMVGPDSER